MGFVEVRGWAGTGRGHHDVLLVIDRSRSTWRPSGADIDGDGRVGQIRRNVRPGDDHPFWTTDAGDTIFQAQVMAARALASRLRPDRARMGLITFAKGATIRAPLGSTPEELTRALFNLPQRGSPYTKFVPPLRRAIEEFQRHGGSDETRHRALILLSDGLPGVANDKEGQRLFTLRAARDAAAHGIRIYAYAIGPNAAAQPDLFIDMIEATGGELVLVSEPANIVEYVPYMSLTRLEGVTIDNLSNSSRARSVRVFPDGSFDAYAQLVPGLNILRITARGEGGTEKVEDVRIRFEKVPANSPARMRQAQRILNDLRIRTIETELATRARHRRARARWRRHLEIEVEDAPDPRPGDVNPPRR